MLCSVLIASRNRFDKLLECVRSVYDCASKEPDFEVIVRLHKSDDEASRRWLELNSRRWDSLHVIWGEDHDGYQSVTRFYQELIDAAKGDWCWHLHDDMVVTGEDWNGKLAQINNHWTLVQPEIHRLNDLVYANEIWPAPIHSREALGRKLLEVGGPTPDMIVFIELVVNRGWPVEFLERVGIWHFPPWGPLIGSSRPRHQWAKSTPSVTKQ
jgi:glycosyl transferase family 2